MKRVHLPIPRIMLLVLIALTSVAALSVVGCDGPRSESDVMVQDPMSDNALQEHLLESERQFWGAIKADDAAGILRLSTDDAIFVHPPGIDLMSGVIEELPTYVVGEFVLGPRVHLVRISDNAVVLAYDLKIGFPSPALDWLMTAAYVNRSGQWLAISRTETRDAQPDSD